MATFCYRRPIYYQEPADDLDELGNHETALSMNELQTQFEEVRAQVQTNSDAIVFLQQQLRMGQATGVPVAPPLTVTSTTNLSGPVRTLDVVISWQATSGLSEVALFWQGVRVLPGPSPTATSYAFNTPQTTSLSVEVGIRVTNQFGTSPIRTTSA
jgi:hypothetical protein